MGALHKNPFWGSAGINTRIRRQSMGGPKYLLVDSKTQDVAGTADTVRNIAVDRSKFVKIFSDQLHVIFSLSPQAIRLFEVVLWIVSEHPNQSSIYLSERLSNEYFTLTKRASLSKSAYYRSRRELIEKDFLSPTSHVNTYWINPVLFWNGDRVKAMKSSEKKADDI